MDSNDDIALVAVGKQLEDAELYSRKTISADKAWLDSAGWHLRRKKLFTLLSVTMKITPLFELGIRSSPPSHYILGSDD